MGNNALTVKRYAVEGMDCANCALTLERSLAHLPGVQSVSVHFATASLEASGDFDPAALARQVEALGYHLAEPDEKKPAAEAKSLDGPLGFVRFLLSERRTALILASAALLLLIWLLDASPFFALLFPGASLAQYMRYRLVIATLQVLAVLPVGLPIARKGFLALFKGRQVTIDLLMTIAALGAIFIGETGEAVTVILLFAIGEALESYSAERSRHALRSLLTLKPETACVLRPCIDCAGHLGQDGYTGGPCPFCGIEEHTVKVEEVQPGETVLIRPGERIPVDGEVLSGASSVNQSAVTGESLPVAKLPGENVFAGTLNGEGALEVRATRPASDSTISRIVRLVEQAQAQRAPVERFIDRFAAWYTPAVVLVAILVAAAPPLLFQQPFFDAPDGTRGWLYRALGLLIVACPCALVISTPVSLVSALSGLARRGVLVKGGIFLDKLASVRVFAFDKTGTLTLGQPTVTQAQTLDCETPDERCAACDDMLALASAVESRSEHPLAQAILSESERRQVQDRYEPASNVTAEAGRGVSGSVNGAALSIRRHAHGPQDAPVAPDAEHPDLHERIASAEAEGHTVMVVHKNGQPMGFIGVADALRPDGAAVLQRLKAIDPRLHTVMLTGDHPAAAQRIAAALPGLDEVCAGLLPADKLAALRRLQAEHGPAAMIGDGINDAPALAGAAVGIALGGAGTAQAIETADAVLMQDDLNRLPDLLKTSRRTRRVIWQNILFSLGIKLAFLALTLPGLATLWMAVFADMGASLLVTANGMRLLKE